MPDVYNPLAVQLVMSGTLNGQLYQNTFYVRKQSGDGWLPEQVEEAVGKLALFWELDLAPLLTNQMTMTEFRGRVMTPIGAAQSIQFGSTAGSRTDEPMPNHIAFCVRASTGFAGRAAAGRTFVGGLTMAQVATNSIVLLDANNIIDAFNTGFRSRLINTGTVPMVPVVYSRFAAGGPRPTALLTDITSYGFFDLTVDSQRRRLPGRGR